MTNFYLIRHGQKHNHYGEPELTDLGFVQAQETGEFLKNKKIDLIITSESKRTVQTAQEIGKKLQLPIQTSKLLGERMYWLDPNDTREDFLREWNKATTDRDYQPKDGQSSHQTGTRGETLIQDVIKNHPKYRNIVLVAHGGNIIDTLRNIFGDEKLAELRKIYPPQQTADFEYDNCAISKISSRDGESFDLELLNFTDHLSAKTEH